MLANERFSLAELRAALAPTAAVNAPGGCAPGSDDPAPEIFT
jgi:hypothetical protein